MPMTHAALRPRRTIRHVFTGRGLFSRDRGHTRVIASVVTGVLVTAGLVVGAVVAPAMADTLLTLTAKAPAQILAGESANVTLTANGSDTTDLYNVAFRYALPAGVSYVPASASGPSATAMPEPTIVTIVDSAGPPAVTHQVLIWSNLADLLKGDSTTLSFTVLPDPAAYLVGSSFAGAGSVFAPTDPRMLVKFNPATGAVIPNTYNASDAAAPAATDITAIEVTKSEPSPEHELMRGVHDQTTVYTLTTRNTNQAPTDNVVIVDYLPADLEFLGCALIDNSAPGTEEYPGSGRLTAVNAGAHCQAPISVETINNRPGFGTDVFTKVTWNLQTLTKGETKTLTYAAGIPLRANVMWSAGTPDPATGAQGSNLDNNTGASTRQEDPAASGRGLTNTVVASGHYTGGVVAESDRAVESTDSVSVRAMDLSIVKSTSTAGFVAGQIAAFSLSLRSSEYVDSSAMTITDTIPNGLCPLVPSSLIVDVSAGRPLPPGCTQSGAVDGATVTAAVANADGSFTVTMKPDLPTAAVAGRLDHNLTHTISYTAFMSPDYDGVGGAHWDGPTAAGDSFANAVGIVGVTADVTTKQESGLIAVTDTSKASLGTSKPSISKLILSRPAPTGTPVDCAAAPDAAYSAASTPETTPTYQLGDTICFKLTVAFSSSTQTRNAVVTDFVPVGTTFAGYQVAPTSGVPNAQVTAVPGTEAASPAGDKPASWLIGEEQSGGRFVAMGTTLTLFVTAIVNAPSTTSGIDITANLMKYRQESTTGTVLALRDQVDFGISAPVVALHKSAPTTIVKEGDVVPFTLTVSNDGAADKGHIFDVRNAVVWDALPVGLDCSTISASTGSCFNYGAVGYPANAVSSNGAQRSVIVWTVAGPLAPGVSTSLTYSVTIPAEVSVSTVFTNNASVVKFASPNTSGGLAQYFPTDSLDNSAATTPRWNAPAANDAATIRLADTAVVKTGVSRIVETNNNANQAVAGELVDYTYNVTVPAGTTVFNGVLNDALPAGLTLTAASIPTAKLDGGSLPPEFTTPLSPDGTLTFPAVWNNTTATAQVFTVTMPGVLVGVGLTSGNLKNTAKFTSKATLNGLKLPDQTSSKTIAVVVPQPTLTKAVDKSNAAGGELVTFTLVAGNSANQPAAYDSVVTDCLPSGLDFTAFLTAPAGTATQQAAGTGIVGNGCAVGTTKLTWTLPGTGALLAPAQATITFSATVSPASAGLVTYSNTATVTGSTLSNGVNDATVEKVVAATSNAATVSVLGATTTKTVAKPTATIGENVDYTITVSIPKNVNFYNAAIIDTLPAGISADAASAIVTCSTNGVPGCLPAITGAALTPAPGLIGWNLGNLAAQPEARTITITLSGIVERTDASNTAGTVRTNQAHLAWNTSDKGNATNANDTFNENGAKGAAAVTLLEPSLSISKSVSNTTPEPGESFTYTVKVTNANTANTSDAHLVTIVDALPAGIDPSKVTAISNGGVLSGSTITWAVDTIAKGASVSLSYQAVLAASGTIGAAAQVNTVKVTSYSSLPAAQPGGRDYTANPPTATATITPDFPHITVAKAVAGGATAYVGTPFGWKVTLTNTGRGTAKAVTATDLLPANWEYAAGTGTVAVNGGVAVALTDPAITGPVTARKLVWPPFAAVAPGGTIVITYSATPSAAALTTPGVGSGVNHPNVVSATATDATDALGNKDAPSYADGPATANAQIHSADVTLVKAAGGALVAGATTADAWTLTVKNTGPDTAVGMLGGRNFLVTDTPGTLPAGVSIVSASGTGWTCSVPNATTGAFTCERTSTVETLANGASFPTITVAVAVSSDVAAGITVANAATVAAHTYDPRPGSNSDNATLTATTSADLSIVKTLITTDLGAGRPITWNLVPNNLGPSVSRADITVTDVVPAGIVGVVATSVGWECTATAAKPADAGDTITCTYTANNGVMPLGVGDEVTLTGAIASSYTGGAIENSATIIPGATTDPVASNNESTTVDSGVPSSSTVIAVEKTLVSPSPVIVPGQNAVYEITVTNRGPADARGVTVSDVLPDALTFVSATGTTGTWTCDGTTNAPRVDCALTGTLSAAAGSNTAVLRLTVSTASGLTGEVVNGATASAANAPDVYDDTATDPLGQADLSITKSHRAGAVVSGTSLDYTLTVTNNGPSDSPQTIEVEDTVPAGLVPTAAVGTGWSCDIAAVTPGSATSIHCRLAGGLVRAAVAAPITVTVDIPADLPAQTLVNTASVDGPLVDPVPGNNTANDPTVITTAAAVSVVKDVASAAPFVAGQSVDYTVTVTNAGPSVANAVRVADVVPTGMTLTAIAGDGWTCAVATADCTRQVLPLGTFTLSITAMIDQAVADGTTLENVANLTWIDSDGSHSGTDPADVTVSAVADLGLTKTAVDAKGTAVTAVTAGTEGRYLLQATNHGPSAAIAPLRIVDQLPVGISYVGVVDSGDWACTAAGADGNGQSVECTWAGTAVLAAGASAHPLTLVVNYDAALPVSDLTNTAIVSSPTTDPDAGNNPAESVVSIDQLTDLSITKTHTGSVRIGNTLAFDLGVKNAGPSVASGITVTDTLPVGLDYVDAAGSDPAWSCAVGAAPAAATAGAASTDAGTAVTCVLTGDLAPGATAPALVITVTVLPAAYPSVVNVASVTGATPESDPTNNTAKDTVTVPALASLTVTKKSTGTFMVGQAGHYTLTVANAGPTEDPGPITLTDKLPAGLTFVSATGANADCVESNQVVTCTLAGALGVGKSVSIALTVNVQQAAYPSVTNSVQVETPTEQLPKAQLTDTDTTSVTAAPPLAGTGFNGLWLLLIALFVLLLGGVLLIVRRRRA